MPVKKQTKATKKDTELPFMIGCDPEFLMFFGSRGLDASHVLTSFFNSGPYTNRNGGFNIPKVGNFGWDGAASTGELRPVATKSIQQMVDNIGTMLKTISDKMPTVDITTLSIGSPIGGHIHVDDFMHKYNAENGFIEEPNLQEMARVRNLMATYLLPIAASDHRVSALARLRGNNYGRLTDLRFERKGKIITCEIRGLTAEWMTTPKIAYATFAYVVTVWHELQKRNKELIKSDFVTRTDEQNENLQKMMLADYKIIERGICQSIKKEIETFELYPTFKNEIDFILKPEKVLDEKRAVGWNIRAGWNFSQTKKPTKKDLLNPTKAMTVLKKQNIPDINLHFGMSYNDDFNVALFSSEIAERVAGLNWQLKNDYFLFGFKKDVDGYAAMTPDGQFFTMPTNAATADVEMVCKKMQSRSRNQNITRIDPKTGQIRKVDNHNKIIIGIPYEERASKNVKGLIELIYNIENNKIEPKARATFDATVTVNKNPKEATLSEIIDQSRDERNYDVSQILSSIEQ